MDVCNNITHMCGAVGRFNHCYARYGRNAKAPAETRKIRTSTATTLDEECKDLSHLPVKSNRCESRGQLFTVVAIPYGD